MMRLRVQTREIGAVNVFDLEGMPTDEALNEVVAKIQKKIRRHRMQRIILNLKNVEALEPIAMRKLLAACLRPKRSLIYGASPATLELIGQAYLPSNVIVAETEAAVAEDLGPFLLEKERDKQIARDEIDSGSERESIGHQVERRRSKRMHVAMPASLKIQSKQGITIETRAIITNISEGGMFCEYLDLDQASKFEDLDAVAGLKVQIIIPPCANFPEEYQVEGVITRKELRKKQLGLAIKFVEG